MSHWHDKESEEIYASDVRQVSQEEKRKEFLAKVDNLLNVRGKDYGETQKNFQRIATLWNIYLDGDGLTPQDVACLMILHKISRIKANNNHGDSWLDIAGYACLAGTMDGICK